MTLRSLLLLLLLFSLAIIETVAYAQNNPAPLRVSFVGDSITFGVGTSDPSHDSYPAQLQRLLGSKWTVSNFGVSGTTLLHNGDSPYIHTKEYQQALQSTPDVLFILLGTNDSKPQNFEAHPDDFVPDYEAMIQAFRNLYPKVKIYALEPVPAYPDNYGIRDSVITEKIIPAITKAASDVQVSLIDLHTPLVDKKADFPDRVHPNEAGAKAVAQIIYGILENDFPASVTTIYPEGRRDLFSSGQLTR